MTGSPGVMPPVMNNRGQPWSSVGLRNVGCVGTGLGNGGTPAPGRYERRRGCLGPFTHDKRWRSHWLRCVGDALVHGEITPIIHTVGTMLATYSGHDGHHVFPSHRRLADDVGRSRSTVQRALRRLRELGLLEWEHRFLGPGPDNPFPRGTSNLYEFLLPADRLARLALRQPRPPAANAGGRTTPRAPRERHHVHRPATGVHDAIASAVASEIRMGTSYDNVRERVLGLGWINTPELELIVHDELERRWAAMHGPGSSSL